MVSPHSRLTPEPLPRQRVHSSDILPHSSPSHPTGSKERRNASVTPRKFKRFFTPRIEKPRSRSSSRRALNELTARSINRNGVQSSPIRPSRYTSDQENTTTAFPRALKRRKTTHTLNDTTADPSTGAKQPGFLPLQEAESDDLEATQLLEQSSAIGTSCEGDEEESFTSLPLKRITPIASRGLPGQLLSLSINSRQQVGRRSYAFPVNDYQDETSRFYSSPLDYHLSTNAGGNRCIPFCTTSCNTNSLVAIGDEEGTVKLLETVYDEAVPSFPNHVLSFRVHTNAIIDMSFSEDDRHLATASGDQSTRVVDMATQTTTAVLGYHTASLKQVRFQPGSSNNSILATSSRDGTVQIWDLRCKGDDGPKHHMYLPVNSPRDVRGQPDPSQVLYSRPINTIDFAHRSFWERPYQALARNETPSHSELAGRLGTVSVTAIQFLPVGQEHLLLTASEADASVQLWDVRYLHAKQQNQTPIAMTRQPESHNHWRNFGITSMNLGGDGSRLYTLCKDNTIYAYSTAHLILGRAPELSTTPQTRPERQQPTREGLGPLYAFRHPKLHATSFYVKSAIRKAKNGRCEMLAVGSSDGCAVLFPTDERYLPQSESRELERHDNLSEPSSIPISGSRRSSAKVMPAPIVEESFPVSTKGTPLVRGHTREVGSLTWTNDGDLITISDDYFVRCWREGDQARDLRVGGEGEGRRWAYGWAEPNAGYDEDDD